MKKIVLILAIILTSCNNADNSSDDNKFSQLDSELYNIILEYQRKFPIPQKVIYPKNELPPIENEFVYIYEVTFFKDNSDTIVNITMSPSGIRDYYNKQNTQIQVNGIYKDKYLKQTYIRDPLKFGKKHIKEYLSNKTEIEQYHFERDLDIDLIYDTKVYKISNDKIVFYEILKGNAK